MLEKPPATLDIDGITIRVTIESMFVWKVVCKGICLNIFTAWAHKFLLKHLNNTYR